jgi:ABC-type multidrug transport system ATPase subunit
MTSLLPGLDTRAAAVAEPGGELLGRVAGLAAGYGGTTTLRGVDLDIRRGELVGVTGENGAGKSTLMRCLAGDLAPTAGEVRLAAGARVELAWQHSALCDNLDVAENLLLGREHRWRLLSTARAHRLARGILADLDLQDELAPTTDLVGQLPEARRQLIALARAASVGPDLLLLDEPTASLGVADTARVEAMVRRLHRRGTTLLLVSHDIEQLFRVADRIVVLRHGRVVGEVDPVRGHPDDVAALVAGHEMDSSAHHQLSRLHALTDRLASADPSSSPLLILSALGTALGADQLTLHVGAPDGGCSAPSACRRTCSSRGSSCRAGPTAGRWAWPAPGPRRSSTPTSGSGAPGGSGATGCGSCASPAPGRCRSTARRDWAGSSRSSATGSAARPAASSTWRCCTAAMPPTRSNATGWSVS